MNKPDGLSIERQIARMQEEFESCKILHGEKSEWAIEAGSILASLIELRDSRAEEGSFNAAEARCRELEADARRYCWAVENAVIETESWRHDGKDPSSTKHVIDAAIDAATAREGGEDGRVS